MFTFLKASLTSIPEGASFKDLVKMKGKDGLGDYICYGFLNMPKEAKNKPLKRLLLTF
jgi:hypothetical protein